MKELWTLFGIALMGVAHYFLYPVFNKDHHDRH